MAEYIAGEIIRILRKEKGIKQEVLCNGLCSIGNLSKIERGKQGIDKFLFDSLMERLGEDPYKYFMGFMSLNDFKLGRKIEEVMELIMNKDYDSVHKEIEKLADKDFFKKGLGLQFVMFARSVVRINQDCVDDDIMEYLFSAVKITRKDFQLEKVFDYVLTRMEINLINMIAIVCFNKGDKEKSVQILTDIVKNIESMYTDDFEKAKIHMLIMYNLSKNLGLMKRYDESVEICDKAIRIGIRNNNMKLLPNIVYNKAWCLYYMGDKKSCETLLYEVYYSARLQNNFMFANRVVEKAQSNFGIEMVVR